MPATLFPPWLQALLSLVGLLGLCWTIYSALRKEGKDAKVAREKADADGKAALLAQIAALKEAIATETQTRVQNQLKTEGDLAAIAGLLQRLAELQEKLITLTEQMKYMGRTQERHEEEFKAVHEELATVRKEITQLLLRDAKHS